MMAARIPDDERLHELLAVRAVEGLSNAEQKELDEYTASHPDFDPDALDRVAASLALAGLRVEPMPAALRARIEADAEAWLARRQPAPGSSAEVARLPARPRPPPAWGGWLAAAAVAVLAVAGWLQVDHLADERAALAERQAALEDAVGSLQLALADAREPTPGGLLAALQASPGTVELPWSATDDPAADKAAGAVYWNAAEQAGVMRFRGLAPNDPAVAQYQLWIFDAERDERFPVDGGVFDVAPDAEETLVPIRARLPVGEAVLFAVTVEPPGGVVVSSRERIALVAQPGA